MRLSLDISIEGYHRLADRARQENKSISAVVEYLAMEAHKSVVVHDQKVMSAIREVADTLDINEVDLGAVLCDIIRAVYENIQQSGDTKKWRNNFFS